MQTEEPFWLGESYSYAITKSDIGLISRNLLFAEKTRDFILLCLDPEQSFMDFGGGYGMFTRLMRDRGFNFYQFDPLCHNLFAEGFEAAQGDRYSLVTAWEVFEHLVNPLNEIEKMLNFSPLIIFSTILLPLNPKPLNEWWYYGTEHGQHIAFYSKNTLSYIASIFNLSLIFSDGNIHILGNSCIDPLRLKVCFNKRYRLFRRFFKKKQPPSLISMDFLKITGKNLI